MVTLRCADPSAFCLCPYTVLGAQHQASVLTQLSCPHIAPLPLADAVTHLTDAQEWAGNGSMVGAIRGEHAVVVLCAPCGSWLPQLDLAAGSWQSDV